MTMIDARGLSCPQPVILVTKEIAAGKGPFEVLIDSECSYENVTRLLESRELTFETEEKETHKIIKVKR